VIAARAHDRSDPLFVPVVVVGIRSLASGSAKYGGPDLLLTVLEHATSNEEQTDPLLDKYTVDWIADALLEKGDSRHLEGMRKLLAATKDVAVREKLERAIAKVVSEAVESQPKVNPKPSIPQAPTTPLPVATPLPSTPIAKVAENPASVGERKSPTWPWFVGIAALLVIVALALKRRTCGRGQL
jgi:hypothetical protein